MRYIDSGQRDSSQALGTWMQFIDAGEVAELRFQTGFFGISGLAFLLPLLARLREANGVTHCLVGSNVLRTGREDLQALVKELGLPRPGAKLAVCAFEGAFFHPKVVHVRRFNGSQAAYVGSANLTWRGVVGLHVEAGVLLDTDDGDPADELERIATAIDAWFVGGRLDFFRVEDNTAVEDLARRGILARESDSGETRALTRPTVAGETPSLPKLAPLLSLPQSGTLGTLVPAASRAGATVPTGGKGATPIEDAYFLMELPKNRISGGSYQADIGKLAFSTFFGGTVGGRADILVNTIATDGRVTGRHQRQLVNVKSRNYRLEIDFPSRYPRLGRPVVVFRRRSRSEFDCLVLLPGSPGHADATTVLTSFATRARGGGMQRTILSEEQLISVWPNCPLLG